MTHEMAHSIGRLGDEYDKNIMGENISDTSDPDKIKWKKLLGFRGVGITAAGTADVFAPGRVCMMRDLGNPFCEVCKMELARRLNNRDYVSRPQSLYVCDPEITIPHSRTGTLDRDSDKYRIAENNITKANGHDLEFRTVVQNMVDAPQHLKMTFRIIGADNKVKYEAEEKYTVQPHSNWYDPDAARESLSVILSNVTDLSSGDRLEGQVIDEATGEILATDKTAGQAWSSVTLRYMLKNEDGTEAPMPDVAPATVYVPKNSAYTLRNPGLYGYTCVGNSENQGQINITEDQREITYYYQKNAGRLEIQTTPVAVTYDGKPHTFDVQQEAGVQIHYSLMENGPYTLTELPSYTQAGTYQIYFKAEKPSFNPSYGTAVLEIAKAATNMQLTAKTDHIKGAGEVELELSRQGLPADAGVQMTCDVSGITLQEKEKDHWIASLPNETKAYTFTVSYSGNANYAESKAACTVRVTAAHSQTGGGAGGVTGGGAGGVSAGDDGTSPAPDHSKEEPDRVTPPADRPASVSPVRVTAKPVVKNKTVKVKNVAATLEKAIIKAEKKSDSGIKDLPVEINYDTGKTKSDKKLLFELDQQAVDLLVEKNVKELKLNSGDVNLTLDTKSLKEIDKKMNSVVTFSVQKVDNKKLSAEAKKIIGERPVYDLSVIGGKKKQSFKLKHGQVHVAISYQASKKENKEKIFAYKIDENGAAVQIPGSYYDPATKTVHFESNDISIVAVGSLTGRQRRL